MKERCLRWCWVLTLLFLLPATPAWAGWHRGGEPPALSSEPAVTVDPLTGGSEMGPIGAGWNHTCAVTASGGVKCWGLNDHGQLGDNSTVNSSIAVDVPGLTGVKALAGGVWHTCALLASGGVKCWGGGTSGQLGYGSVYDSKVPVSVKNLPGPVVAIAAGFYHTCALIDTGAMVCWGQNGSGEVGDGSTYGARTPVGVFGLSSGVSGMAAGFESTCALLASGGVRCWGRNLFGELGDGTTTLSRIPVDVKGLAGAATAITIGDFHTCALLQSGDVQCWGTNNGGQMGLPPSTGSLTPVTVPGLSGGLKALAAGGFHTCALLVDGGMLCWGTNGMGQLGNGGSYYHTYIPGPVVGLAGPVSQMASGQMHMCALITSGKVQCWGDNPYGQVGNGTTGYSKWPVSVWMNAPAARLYLPLALRR